MELRHLRYCIAVADAGSFTLAAARLRVAQQAISRQIADLEWELGVKLFERGSRGTTLTPAGAVFVHDARSVIERAQRAASRARTEPAGRLAIGFSHLSPDQLRRVGAAVAALQAASPGITVEMRQVPTGAQPAALLQGEIDIGVGYLVAPDVGDLASELVCGDAVSGVVLPADHPLAALPVLRLRDLAPWPMIAIAREVNPVAHDSSLNGLEDRGLVPDVAYVRAVGLSALLLVASGYGWQLAPTSFKAQVASLPSVAYRKFSDSPFPFGLSVRWPRGRPPATAQRFVDFCCRMRNPAADFLNGL